MGNRPLPHHAAQEQKTLRHMNHHSKEPISPAQMQHMHQKGAHLLPMLPRSLLVCGMLWLPPCLQCKQSFNTRLISAKKMVCQWGSISHDIPEISVATILSFESSLSSLTPIPNEGSISKFFFKSNPYFYSGIPFQTLNVFAQKRSFMSYNF